MRIQIGRESRAYPVPLQAAVDASPNGATIELGEGTFYADPANHATPLLVNQFGISLLGDGQLQTKIGCPVLWSAGYGHLADVGLLPATGSAYALKIYRAAAAYVQRSRFERLTLGAVGNRPVNALYLDGSILNDFVGCTFASATGSNVVLDTSDSSGTNVNRFQGCTSNSSSRYGYEIIGGTVGGVHILGGNVEDNAVGALVATSMNDIHIEGVDFENSIDGIVDTVGIFTCNPARIVNCNFISFAAVQPTRAFQFAGCQGALVSGCRFSGFAAGGIGVFDPNTVGIIDPSNVITDPADRIFIHRGRLPQ